MLSNLNSSTLGFLFPLRFVVVLLISPFSLLSSPFLPFPDTRPSFVPSLSLFASLCLSLSLSHPPTLPPSYPPTSSVSPCPALPCPVLPTCPPCPPLLHNSLQLKLFPPFLPSFLLVTVDSLFNNPQVSPSLPHPPSIHPPAPPSS